MVVNGTKNLFVIQKLFKKKKQILVIKLYFFVLMNTAFQSNVSLN